MGSNVSRLTTTTRGSVTEKIRYEDVENIIIYNVISRTLDGVQLGAASRKPLQRVSR